MKRRYWWILLVMSAIIIQRGYFGFVWSSDRYGEGILYWTAWNLFRFAYVMVGLFVIPVLITALIWPFKRDVFKTVRVLQIVTCLGIFSALGYLVPH